MRRIESQRDQFPFRVAAHPCHPDLAESHRAHGTVHTSGGRILPGWKLAMADAATQQSRLADPLGWSHHVAVQPSGLAVAGAQAYASLKGLADPHDTDYTHIMQTPERVARVGRHYDAMPLHDPAALPHYHSMLKEVGDQYDFLTNRLGIKVQPVDHDPYAHVGEMMADVNNNKTLKVLGTHVTGGHPVFGNEGNDQFRAVHDFFGHAATGRDFDRHGEHATYLAHAKMFTPQAFPALTNETLGQNSSLILNGHFGPQKIGMIPREITASRTAMGTMDFRLPVEELHHYATWGLDDDTDPSDYPNLNEDVRANGILQPLTITTDGELAYLKDGYHRGNAAHKAGLSHVPVNIEHVPYVRDDEGVPLGSSLREHLFGRSLGRFHARRTAARLAWRDDDEEDEDEVLEGYPQEVHPLSMSTPMYPDFKSRHTIFDSELNRDVQHFSPHEINPASDGLSRPHLEWERGNHPEHPTLDLDLPSGTGGQSESGYRMNLPTDRHPVTLYRGVSLPLDHPDLHQVRRMLHGDRYEYGDPGLVTPLRSPGGFSYYDGVQEYFLDPDMHDQALTRRSGWQWSEPPHPDLHRMILDHINKNHGGLGTHWTDDRSQAVEFAGHTSNGVNLPVIFTQKWMGTGEDPYRRGTDGEWTDEREITKLRGAPVNLSQIEIKHSPELDTSPRWRTIYDGEGLRHQAMRLTADSSGRPSNTYSEPEGLDTPRWSAQDRPQNSDGTYHFSPDEINPPADTYARPPLTTYFDYPHEDSPLPFGPDAGVEWNDYFDQHEAVERQPTELHRGFKLSLTDTTSPPLAQIRRMIHGPEHEDDTDLWWNAHGGPEGQGGYDFTLPGMGDYSNRALTRSTPQGITHPDVPRLIMDHLLNFNDHSKPPTHPLDESKHNTELGRHWATSLDSARKFSGVYPWTTHHPQHRLSVVLSGHWKGQGEDPYRRYTEGDFDDEHEVTLLPGAPLDIHSVHVFDPRNMFWHTHHMGGARHHAGKNVTSGPKRVRP